MNRNKNILVDIHRKTVAMLLLLAQLHTSCSTSLDKNNFNTNIVESCAVDDYKPTFCKKPKIEVPNKPAVTKLVVTTKKDQNVVFEQKEQLVAHVKESCPQGFSRTLTLPIIISNDFIQNVKQPNNSSLDALMQIMSQHNPKQIIHVFTPEMVKSLPSYQKMVFVKDGVVYVGYVGLMGGGGDCIKWVGGAFAVVVFVGFGMIFGEVMTGIQMGPEIRGFVSCIASILDADEVNKTEEAAKKAEANAELDKTIENIDKYSNTVIPEVNGIVDQVEQIGYEKIMDTLSKLESFKRSLYSRISDLESYKYNSYTSDRSYTINSNIDRLRDKIRNIDNKIAEAKSRAQKQAREKFDKDMNDMDKSSYDTDVTLNDMLHGIESTDFNNNKSSVSNATNEASSNITKLEYWERQPVMSFDSSDIKNVRKELANKRLRQEKVNNVHGLVEFAGSYDSGVECVQQLCSKDIKKEDIDTIITNATKKGLMPVLKYCYLNKNINLNNIVDHANDTLLHKAVTSRQLEVVKYLVRHGLNVSTKNANNQTPLDIAIKNKNQAMIDALQGR